MNHLWRNRVVMTVSLLAAFAATSTLRAADVPATIEEIVKPFRNLPTLGQKLTFFGITIEKLDYQAKEKYGFQGFMGCYVSDPGKYWKDLGISTLEPGAQVSMIADVNRVVNRTALFPASLAAATLECRSKSIVEEGQKKYYLVRWVIKHPKTTDPQSGYSDELIKITPEGLKELETIFRPVTIAGVTFSYADQELRDKHGMAINEFVIVTGVNKEVVHGGLEKLKEGHSIIMVSVPGTGSGVFCPVDLGINILKFIEPSQGDPNTYTVDLSVVTHKKGEQTPDSQSYTLRLKAEDLRALAAAVKPRAAGSANKAMNSDKK
ncbi:MAG: hypothetical protein HZA11_06465 [Nitrospirae bacterium]|nr:hypothetical protein [Nitrospirota bacterium]